MLRKHLMMAAGLAAVLMMPEGEAETTGGSAEGKAADKKDPKPKADPKPKEPVKAKVAEEPEVADDLKVKQDAAKKAAVAATVAARAAETATREAARRAQEAAALQAEAEGLVVISSPRRFGIVVQKDIGNNKYEQATVFIEKGNSRVPREHAEHPYAISHGVEILGLPIADKK